MTSSSKALGVLIPVIVDRVRVSPDDQIAMFSQGENLLTGDDMWLGREMLYGSPGHRYVGLLSVPSSAPLPPSTMTRQRRRAAARRAAKV